MSNNDTITYIFEGELKIINFDEQPSYLDDLYQDVIGYYRDKDEKIIRYKDDLIK